MQEEIKGSCQNLYPFFSFNFTITSWKNITRNWKKYDSTSKAKPQIYHYMELACRTLPILYIASFTHVYLFFSSKNCNQNKYKKKQHSSTFKIINYDKNNHIKVILCPSSFCFMLKIPRKILDKKTEKPSFIENTQKLKLKQLTKRNNQY